MSPLLRSLCFLLLLSGAAHAQLLELEITPFERSGPIPVFRDHPDKVAVIFRSSLTNLQFDSNLGVTANLSEASKGEYVLILNPVRQSVTVNAAGFKQERIQITLTEPRQVAYYRIEPKPQVATTLIPTIIQVTPADAIVSIDGIRVDISRPVPIEVGTHRIRIEKQGFRTIDKEVRVSAEQNLIRETLAAIDVVPVTIKTQPAGATVLLDGVQVGITDRNGDIGLFRFPGTYQLSVQLSGYLTETRPITVTESGTNAFSINLTRNSGTLRLTVSPSDATVLLNRQPYNPSQPAELAPGMVLVQVSKPDHEPFSESVEIVRGQTVTRSITLTPHLGGLQITPTPLQANWTLTDASGRVVMSGTGLGRKTDVPVGSYRLTTRASGYQDKVEAIRIEKNVVTTKTIELVVGAPTPTPTRRVESLACVLPIKDIDGNTYKTVQIGTQCWMAENLRTSKYRNGNPIPNVTGNSQWGSLTTGAWAHYDNRTANETVYGKLYNWHAVADRRNVCPTGWHVPSDAEWTVLSNFLATDVGFKMKATTFEGSNASGFNGLPGGNRGTGGTFFDVGSYGYFWGSSEYFSVLSRGRNLTRLNSDLDSSDNGKRLGFSVRCVRD